MQMNHESNSENPNKMLQNWKNKTCSQNKWINSLKSKKNHVCVSCGKNKANFICIRKKCEHRLFCKNCRNKHDQRKKCEGFNFEINRLLESEEIKNVVKNLNQCKSKLKKFSKEKIKKWTQKFKGKILTAN